MNNCEEQLHTFNCQKIGDILIFVSSNMNLVFKYYLNENRIMLLDAPDEKFWGSSLYGSIEVWGNDIFLIPFTAKNIWKYSDDRWEKKIYPQPEELLKCMGTFKNGNLIYLFGYESGKITKFNICDGSFITVYDAAEITNVCDRESGYFGMDYEIIGDKLYFPLLNENAIIVLDYQGNDEITIIDIPSSNIGYSGIARVEDGIWLSPRRGKQYVKYRFDGTIETFNLPDKYKADCMYFGGAHRVGDKILFTAFDGKNFLFNVNAPEIYEMTDSSIYYYKEFTDGTAVLSERYGGTYYIDRNHNKRELKLSIDANVMKLYIKKFYVQNNIAMERTNFGLKDFLEIV